MPPIWIRTRRLNMGDANGRTRKMTNIIIFLSIEKINLRYLIFYFLKYNIISSSQIWNLKSFLHLQSLLIAHISFRCPAALFMLLPPTSDIYCQYITPPNQPNSVYALLTHDPKSVDSTAPVLEASAAVTGLPITIFFAGIPLAMIYFTEVPEKNEPEDSKRAS